MAACLREPFERWRYPHNRRQVCFFLDGFAGVAGFARAENRTPVILTTGCAAMAVFDTMHAIGRDETLLLCDGREIATFANDTPFNAEYFADLANLVEASLAYVDCFDIGGEG